MMKFLIGLIMFLSPQVYAASSTYNCKITYQADVSTTTVSTKILALSAGRRCLTILNKGSSTIYIKLNSAHTTSTEGIAITAGGSWEPFIPPTNSMYFVMPVGPATTTVLEGK